MFEFIISVAIIPTLDGLNLLIGNHYFSPENISNYSRFVENKLDTHNFLVITVGDCNAPGFDWKNGLSVPNSHYTSTCLLNLNLCIDTIGSSNLLDLNFSNLSDLGITPIDPELIKPDSYHPL
jgi:hypothetical protein